MTHFNKAIKTLEFDKVSEMLAAHARTEGARLLARTLTPETDAVRVEKMQSDTEAAKFMINKKGNPSFGDVSDISDAVERAQKKATLIPKELLDIADYVTEKTNNEGAVADLIDSLEEILSGKA